jgi:hypothetical protein
MRASHTGFLAIVGLLAAVPVAAQSAEDIGKTAGNIVTQPLKDVNIIKESIPPILAAASAAPYSLSGLKTCQQFSAEIGRLTAVLGPDVDAVKPKEGETPGEMVLGGLESVAGGLIPGVGIIRKVTGAEAHDKKVKAAVYAGAVRRAYLKGTARAKGCKI